MDRIRIRIKLNEGRKGIPLKKLSSIATETDQFFEMLARDLKIGTDGGQSPPHAHLLRWREQVRDRVREHYRAEPAWWAELLARPTVTLLCRCRTPLPCVRQVLAEVLQKLGAVYEGEIEWPEPRW